MSESLPSGKLLHSLFASFCWISYFLAMYNSRYVKVWEEFDRCKIHRMDKICLNVSTFEESATYSCAANCGHPHWEMFAIMWSLFKIMWMKPTVSETAWKKPFQQTSGIDSMIKIFHHDQSNSSIGKHFFPKKMNHRAPQWTNSLVIQWSQIFIFILQGLKMYKQTMLQVILGKP